MGQGIGIGIGWPASSGTSQKFNSGHWEILSYCPSGLVVVDVVTNYQENVNWNPGDYVTLQSGTNRVLLGTFYGDEIPTGSAIENVIGPVYNSCE
jgi:hypothetical protein